MKKLSTLFLAMLLSTQTFAMQVNVVDDYSNLAEPEEVVNNLGESGSTDTTGIANCNETPDSTEDSSPFADLEALSPTTNDRPINFCNKRLLYGGDNPSRREKKRMQRKMRRQCKKKAKAYKRAVARELLGNMQLGRLVQVAFKSKKKIMRNSGTRNLNLNLNTDIDPSVVENMSKEEFSNYMMNRIRQQVPHLDDLMAQSNNPSDAFTTGAFDKNETYPMNVVVQGANGNKCVVKGDEFPEEEEFEPETCELCENVNIQDSFHNDCSYMVGAGLSESEARELVGASENKAAAGSDQYCNQDPDRAGQGVRQLNETADKLCEIAANGMTPNFQIEASRNLYNDYTPDLAAKRGDFTRKYLFDRLQKKCEGLEDAPAWLTDQDAFAEVVEVKHPEYLRPDNTPGNYGPDPNASGAQRELEAQYLRDTLTKELSDIDEEINELSAKKASIEIEISALNEKLNGGNGRRGIRQNYDALKDDMERTDLRLIEDQQVIMSQYIHEAELAMAQKKKLQQDLHDINTRISSLEEDKSKPKFQTNAGQFVMVEKLSQYYEQRDASGASQEFKDQWDEELFNQFKMARISGSVEKVNEFGIPEELMTPELQIAMKSLVKIQSYTCELAPMQTEKVRLQGVLKGALKVVTAATLPAIAVVGAASTIAVSPITTGISLFCQGCREPGQTPPILQWGNLFALDLSKRGRRQAWRATQGFLSNYVNWGGALKVRGNREIRVHELRDYARRNGKNYDNLDPAEQDQIIDQVIAEVEAANNLNRQPAFGCDNHTRGDVINDGDIPQTDDSGTQSDPSSGDVFYND